MLPVGTAAGHGADDCKRGGIVADGRTQTAVANHGAVTNITTGTVRGNNAFNSFSTFNVAQGQTATCSCPTVRST